MGARYRDLGTKIGEIGCGAVEERYTASMADVAIVGAGPSGLAAALALVRARKRVLLFDCWPPRNAAASEVRGYVTQDGTPPAELRKIAQEQLGKYDSFEMRDETRVTNIRRDGERFVVEDSQGELCQARRVLLCVGIVDRLPDLPGYRELWGTSLFQCPYCHGWESRDRAWGYLANDRDAVAWARLLRAWTKDLIVFTQGQFTVDDELRRSLERCKIQLEERRVTALRSEGGRLAGVQVDGGVVARDVLFVRPPQRQTELVERLGLACTTPDRVTVDDQYQTSIRGIYAAGDLVAHEHGATTAAASGVSAAHALDEQLTIELAECGAL